MRLRIISHLTILSVFAVSFFVFSAKAEAEDFFNWEAITYPLQQKFDWISPQGEFKISLAADSLTKSIHLKSLAILNQAQIKDYFNLPEKKSPATDLYYVDFGTGVRNTISSSPTISIKYHDDNKVKNIYYYNWVTLNFEKLEHRRDIATKTLTFEAPNLDAFTFAVFEEDEDEGLASWYVNPKFKTQLIAASTDFKKGTVLKVVNEENSKAVVVTVQDYGPKKCADWTAEENRKMGPCKERTLDLSSVAFKKIAATSQGVIKVKVIPQ